MFKQLFQSVVQCLADNELPVRVSSVVAMKEFVENMEDTSDFKGVLPNVLTEFFKVLNEVDNERLVMTLETIVEKFGEDIAPYAVQMTQQLVSTFWTYLRNEEAGDDGEMGALATVGCLRAIVTILESLSSVKQIYEQLEGILFPVFQRMLCEEGQDIYEELLEILACLTYYSPSISQRLWSLWEPIVQQASTWAANYMDHVAVVLNNFIFRSSDVFLASRQPDCLSQVSVDTQDDG